jgi:hypothetical protein
VMAADELMTDQATPAVDRVNVALVAEAAEALDKLQSRTRMKKVDVVNRALKLYEFVDAEIRAGNRLLIRDEEGNDYLVKLLY